MKLKKYTPNTYVNPDETNTRKNQVIERGKMKVTFSIKENQTNTKNNNELLLNIKI